MLITPHSLQHSLPSALRQPGDVGGALRGRQPDTERIDVDRIRRRVVEPAAKAAPEPIHVSAGKSGFASQAAKLVKKALTGLARDVGRAFEAVGLDPSAGKALLDGFVQPLLKAIRAGGDVTAQFRLVAAQSSRLVTASGVAESVSIFAKSVQISVNHDSGQVDISVQSLAIEQDSVVDFHDGPIAASLSAPPVDLLEFLERALPPEERREGDRPPQKPSPLQAFDPPLELLPPVSDEEISGDATEGVRSRLRLHAFERIRSEAGEQVSRFHLDLRISLTRQLGAEAERLVPLLPEPALDLSV